MSDDGLIRISSRLSIPAAELTYRATRAGGPGGQHVNTSATRIELTWNVAESPSLNEDQRSLLLERLATRIDSRGVLRLVESGSRSQFQNREAVSERLQVLVAAALRPRRKRKKTTPGRAAREERLRAKKKRSEVKKRRTRPSEED